MGKSTTIPETHVSCETLSNGLTVTFEPLPHLHSVSVGIWIRAGSSNETRDQAGISHFLEHLFFKGTKTRNVHDLMAAIERRGGHLNAFTTRDYTCLYVRTLDSNVETAVEILADILKNSTFGDLEKERNVILEEIAAGQDVPEDFVHDALMANLWPKHPLGFPIAGTLESVTSLDLNAVQSYYHAWYKPGEIFFSVSGNFDRDKIFDQIQRELQVLPISTAPERDGSPEFVSGIELIERDIAQHHLCIAFPGFSNTGERRFTMDMLSSALGGGSTSRLFERIREEEGLAYSIYTYHSAYSQGGLFGIYAAVAPENLEKTIALICEELRALQESPLDNEELETNAEQLKGNMLMALESTFNRMAHMARSKMTHGRVRTIAEIIKSIEAVTAQDIQDQARATFTLDNANMTVLGPSNGGNLRLDL